MGTNVYGVKRGDAEIPLSGNLTREAWLALANAAQALLKVAQAGLGENVSPPVIALSPTHISGLTVVDAINGFLIAKARSKKSDRYLRALKNSLSKFARARSQLPLDAVTTEQLEIWLAESGWAAETQAGYLRVISCWADGPAALVLADLRRRFPAVQVQAKGLLATEAVVTLPFNGLHPVAIQSHFFEFIDSHGHTHLAHELDDGEEYEVAVTTAGGLWRYRLHDRIKVAGFLGRTPSLQFVGRTGNVTDLFGEKLSEPFVAEALRQCLVEVGAQPHFALIAPDEDATGWRYTLYIEGEAPASLAESLDQSLRENPHYAYCRELGQLLPSRIFAIKQGGYEMFCRRQVAEGKRLGEIKPTLLSGTSGWSQIFLGAYIGKTGEEVAA